MSNQILTIKVNEPLKTFSIFHTMHLCEVNHISKQTTPTVQNCACSNALCCLKNSISEFFRTQIITMKVDESINTIFYLTHYASLLRSANLETDHTHFLKLCLLKHAVLYKKQIFRDFESSNIRNENKQVNKTHFLSCKGYLSINLSKI